MIRRITPFIAGIILLGLCLAACNRPISVTTRNSATPVPPTLDELSLTRTAIAGPIIATLTAAELTPGAQTQKTTVGPTVETPPTPATPIVTVGVVTEVPVTPVVKATAAAKKPAVVQPVMNLPKVYWLQRGEFPFCLARRFNIDPGQLMWVNGFCCGQVFYPGQGVLFPDNPLPFPGRRALHLHPATYRVRPGDTIYKIACFFGDVDPVYLAQDNGLTPPYRLQAGQILNIP
jgi:LysM repeat protein